MIKAHLSFTQHYNSFSVVVKNLEKLSVEQIQEIEAFVQKRKGIFDFNTYTFVIQKKIDFNMFVTLINNSNINAYCQENVISKKEYKRIGFGQYKGMQYNELPDSYMLWLKSNYHGYEKDDINKELQKRKF